MVIISYSCSNNLEGMPWWDSNLGSGDRQLAVSGNTLDHTAIRAVPRTFYLPIESAAQPPPPASNSHFQYLLGFLTARQTGNLIYAFPGCIASSLNEITISCFHWVRWCEAGLDSKGFLCICDIKPSNADAFSSKTQGRKDFWKLF